MTHEIEYQIVKGNRGGQPRRLCPLSSLWRRRRRRPRDFTACIAHTPVLLTVKSYKRTVSASPPRRASRRAPPRARARAFDAPRRSPSKDAPAVSRTPASSARPATPARPRPPIQLEPPPARRLISACTPPLPSRYRRTCAPSDVVTLLTRSDEEAAALKAHHYVGGEAPVGRAEQISKQLSSTLRHRAAQDGVELDAGGFADVERLLSSPKFRNLNISMRELTLIVQWNEKKRFGTDQGICGLCSPTARKKGRGTGA